MGVKAKLLKQIEDLTKKVSAQIHSGKKSDGFDTAALEAFGKDLEKRIMGQIPLNGMPAIHQTSVIDRKHLNAQLKFMCQHDKGYKAPDADMKALGLEVGAEGGFLVPEEFIAEVLRKLTKVSVIRPNARIFPGVGKKGTIPRETGTVSIIREGENVATAETTNPAFGNIAWNLNKYKGLTKISDELIRHGEVDVVDLLGDMFAEQYAIEEDKDHMDGSGSLRATGLRKLASVSSLAQALANLAYDDLVKIKHLLKVQYRRNAMWILHNDIISLIARLKDADGRPIFLDISNFGGQSGLGNTNLPPQTIGWLLGNPVLDHADIPVDLGGGSNESEIWYTDLKKSYDIFDGGAVEMSSTSEGFGTFEADQVAVKMLKFMDAKGAIAEAAVFLSGVK